MSFYHRARPGADLPLQLPTARSVNEGFADAIAGFGYPNTGFRETDIEFQTALDVDDVTAMAGLAAARDAIREGAVSHWRVGVAFFGESQRQRSGSLRATSSSVRLSPRGTDFQLRHRHRNRFRHRCRRSRARDGTGARHTAEKLATASTPPPTNSSLSSAVSGRHCRNDTGATLRSASGTSSSCASTCGASVSCSSSGHSRSREATPSRNHRWPGTSCG